MTILESFFSMIVKQLSILYIRWKFGEISRISTIDIS